MAEQERNEPYKPNDHLANERTYLAWVRTGIGIMAFGFVVVKFSLFVKQIGLALQTKANARSHGYSAIIGIILVSMGALSIFFAFLQYKKTNKQLKTYTYAPSTMSVSMLTAVILLISILLIAYLLQSV
jgi:putative membrane protein